MDIDVRSEARQSDTKLPKSEHKAGDSSVCVVKAISQWAAAHSSPCSVVLDLKTSGVRNVTNKSRIH